MMHAIRRLLSFFHRNRLDDQLSEEIQLHLELRRQALIDAGMSPAAAEYEARRQFGNATAIRERTRDQWGSPAVDAFFRDLGFAARMMAHSPGLSGVVILAIALGAGVNAALFLLLDNMLLRTQDIPAANRVVWLDDGRPLLGPTYPDYVDYRDRASAAMDLAAYAMTEVAARPRADDERTSLRAVLASGNYFSVLQARPTLGRTFGPAEDLPPLGTASVVLGDAYWNRRFNRDPNVLGPDHRDQFQTLHDRWRAAGRLQRRACTERQSLRAGRMGPPLVSTAARAWRYAPCRADSVVGPPGDRPTA
ncbi:MAG: hypothetical protein GEU99_14445 [Luteitalea sp.]|nr:hypothetical protein [Luteitalea sp.]